MSSRSSLVRAVWAAVAALALAALLSTTRSVAPAASGQSEVVVYSARHYGNEPAFEAFTRKTGIAVKTFAGSSAELFERLRA